MMCVSLPPGRTCQRERLVPRSTGSVGPEPADFHRP